MARLTGLTCIIILSSIHAAPAAAQICTGQPPDLLILLDRSATMSQTIGGLSKWEHARAAIADLTTAFHGQARFGLQLYPLFPATTGSECHGGQINVPVSDTAQSAIATTLATAYPGGLTPLGAALSIGGAYLKGVDPGRPKAIVLITDGNETCKGNAPVEAADLKALGIKTYVVGFGSEANPWGLEPIAVNGGTAIEGPKGTPVYYQADDANQLRAFLKAIAGLVTCCGNGVLDTGEQCDTAIGSGAIGACPSACADQDPCTVDSLTGSGCKVICSHTVITVAQNGDRCCPKGASALTDSDCLAACGNGLLEPGELCDPGIPSGAGKCKTLADCDDQDVCTTDTLELTTGACSATCKHTKRSSSLGQSDGCCPAGATALTDGDCPAGCGNGLLEPGELCDPGISSGAGKCKTLADCDDQDPCTADALAGGACTLSCSHTPVAPTLGAKDGCCAAGATALTDADCQATCGNGALEAGELCDTGISSGPGRCPTAAECADQDPCTSEALQGSGCQAVCVTRAVAADPKQKDGCCPAKLTLDEDADCLPLCDPDHLEGCANPCDGVKCPDGQYCKKGECVPWPKQDETESGPEAPPFNAGVGGCDCRIAQSDATRSWIALLGALSLTVLLGLSLLRQRRRRSTTRS